MISDFFLHASGIYRSSYPSGCTTLVQLCQPPKLLYARACSVPTGDSTSSLTGGMLCHINMLHSAVSNTSRCSASDFNVLRNRIGVRASACLATSSAAVDFFRLSGLRRSLTPLSSSQPPPRPLCGRGAEHRRPSSGHGGPNSILDAALHHAGAMAAVFNLRNMHKLKMIKNANDLSYKKYIPASSSARPCIPAQGSGAIAIGSEDHRPRHGGDHAGKRPDARLDHRADDPERLHRWIGWRRQ